MGNIPNCCEDAIETRPNIPQTAQMKPGQITHKKIEARVNDLRKMEMPLS